MGDKLLNEIREAHLAFRRMTSGFHHDDQTAKAVEKLFALNVGLAERVIELEGRVAKLEVPIDEEQDAGEGNGKAPLDAARDEWFRRYMKRPKPELVAVATELELDATGTRRDLAERIARAFVHGVPARA